MWKLHIGDDLRKLAIKMCAGLAEYFRPQENIISESALKFLFEDSNNGLVRLVKPRDGGLDKHRPELSHSIFVEANGRTGRCYGVVRFFGSIEFYTILHDQYAGSSFAGFASLDLLSQSEDFRLVDPLNLPEPFKSVSAHEYKEIIRNVESRIVRLFVSTAGADKQGSSPQRPLIATWEMSLREWSSSTVQWFTRKSAPPHSA